MQKCSISNINIHPTNYGNIVNAEHERWISNVSDLLTYAQCLFVSWGFEPSLIRTTIHIDKVLLLRTLTTESRIKIEPVLSDDVIPLTITNSLTSRPSFRATRGKEGKHPDRDHTKVGRYSGCRLKQFLMAAVISFNRQQFIVTLIFLTLSV